MAILQWPQYPLIKELSTRTDLKQLWYPDDAAAAGSLEEIKKWWDGINLLDGAYGYYPNVAKTSLLVKEGACEKICELFDGTGVNVTTNGVNMLGCPIGTDSFVSEQIKSKIGD